MKIDTFFIVNAALLVALIAGASYLQKMYDPDQAPKEAASAPSAAAAVSDDSSGWHLSTSTPAATAATTVAPVTQSAPKTTAVPAPKPVRRVYNEERDDD